MQVEINDITNKIDEMNGNLNQNEFKNYVNIIKTEKHKPSIDISSVSVINSDINKHFKSSPFHSFRTQPLSEDQGTNNLEINEKMKIIEDRISNLEFRLNNRLDYIKKYMEGANTCLKDHDLKLNSYETSINDLHNKMLKQKDENTP